ncbi:DUF6778 family protein [Celeribacter persicus]|uniref:Lipoprotein n=1 Tax=Celeribacter persicus TaxID=1651082 RepID=A0A2T5HTK5_9RHOB|nr:DUF6778 family protein [Celeribacter persicus]PTQ74925.1 hypothetical protein C8N42_103216 [Celeribacter persicus]
MVKAIKRRFKIVAVFFSCALLLTACAQTWSTDYDQAPAAQVARGWNVSSLSVNVPKELTVSEANVYAPNADIVWREDPLGDRHEQVRSIVTVAAKRGVAGLSGRTPVKLTITVHEFHALSDITRYQLSHSGVHNIRFSIAVHDARSGKLLAYEEGVKADLIAFTGQQAREAEKLGLTQKVRITDHIAKVIASWLGTGPDVRTSFVRSGR